MKILEKDLQGEGLKAYNPATGDLIGSIQKTDLSNIPDMYQKARQAQKIWSEYSYARRARHIKKMRRYIVDHAEQLAEIVSIDNGKSRIDALATEVIPCALSASWYARHAESVLAPRAVPGSTLLFFNKRNQIIRLPLGVVGIISPWNYPLSIPFGEIVMGLMAGNAIMLKVASATTVVGKAIEKIVEAGGLPDGLFQHIVCSGSDISRVFFDNNQIDKVFFTGSVAVGKTIMAEAAKNLVPVSLELGGKDPMIVLEDADLERAANGAAWAGYQNAGQSCGGVERIYVQEKVYDEFVEKLAEKTRAMRHGPDHDFQVEMGAMTTEGQLELVKKHVESALKNGAKIVAQSSGPGVGSVKSSADASGASDDNKGMFFPATLIVDVNHSMEIMREETFGPVLPVMPFSSIEDAIELANDSTMALTSSVWTRSNRKGKKIAERLHSGVTTINDHLYTHGQSEAPWGGWKESGLGRTHSHLGLEEMTHAKVINWDIMRTKRNLWWFPFNPETYRALISALRFAFPRSIFEFFNDSIKMSVFLVKKMFTSWKIKK